LCRAGGFGTSGLAASVQIGWFLLGLRTAYQPSRVKWSTVKKLIEQLMKFGIVGAIAFVIDWGLMNILLTFHMHNVLATSISFFVSLIFNYLASMKYVFRHRDDMARWMEIAIFFCSAFVGWIMNEVIVWISTSWMPHDSMYSMHAQYVLWTNIGKLIATIVVMIWNFVIRKWLLDDTHTNAMNRLKAESDRLTAEQLEAKWERSFSHRLGLWSLSHTPKGWS
jgi:putative flippase GtrA